MLGVFITFPQTVLAAGEWLKGLEAVRFYELWVLVELLRIGWEPEITGMMAGGVV